MTTKRMIVCSSYGGISAETNLGITECLKRGWASYSNIGCPDVALARNVSLTKALENVPEDPEYVILMVDDDMLFSCDEAECVCHLAQQFCRPVSGIYSTARGTIAATELVTELVTGSNETWERKRYLTGLGFLAIPAPSLYSLALSSRVTTHDSMSIVVFTWTGPREGGDHISCRLIERSPGEYIVPDMWMSEDYRLTLRLGGAYLARLGIGHVKRVPIRPDGETVHRFGQV